LAKENAHLIEELEKYKSASLQALKLSKHNQIVTAELQTVSQANKDTEIAGQRGPKASDSKLNIISTNSLSSLRRTEYGDSKSIALETYNSLVTKYNLVFQNWTDIKATRAQLEKSLRGEKEKAKRYNQFCDSLEKKIEQKRDRIRELEEKVRSLAVQIQTLRQSREAQQTSGPKSLEAATRGFSSASVSPMHHHSEGGATNIIGILDPPINNVSSREIEFAERSILEDSRFQKRHTPGANSRSSYQEDATRHSKRSDKHAESEANELPRLWSGKNSENAIIEDAGHGQVVPHHSSSTEGDGVSNSPSKTSSHGPIVKMESPVDIRSLNDSPVVVLERSVKKRKSRNKPTASKIKVETISSSPIGLSAFPGLEPHESLNLDDIGHKQSTPRKQRSLMRNLVRDMSYESRSSRKDGKRNALQPSSSVNQSSCSAHRSTKRRRVTSDITFEGLNEDGENLQPMERSSRRNLSPDLDGRLVELLENPISSNHTAIPIDLYGPVNSLDNGCNIPAKSNATCAPVQDPSSVATGKVSPPSGLSPKGSPRNSAGLQRPSPKSIVRDFAHSPCPQPRDSSNCYSGSSDAPLSEGLSRASAELSRPAYGRSLRGTITPQVSNSANSPAGNPSISSTTQKGKSLSRAEYDSHMNELPQNGPLRTQPLRKLGLHDFKINPDYNHGYNYAFMDVVRNQAERRCLQGCTKPECCGNTFRALAAASWDPSKLPTASQEEVNTRLLKEFMGDNAHKIRHMTKAEKDETLLQAKTRELANKHGRHRQAYERRRSPPGFWRLEFPSTQEEREDRQKGEQHERDLVAQRYGEAMRPGGAYLFRDE
jgi:hypothetical protein